MIKIANFEQAARFELLFWLQIMGDHGRFILGALPVEEQQEIEKAQYFIIAFDNFLQAVRGNQNLNRLNDIVKETQAFRTFKAHLLKRHLSEDIKINLPPTFINHMLNELDEFLLVLSYLSKQQVPPVFNPVHYHLLWVLDGAGHAAAIQSNLDEVEKDMIMTARQFEKNFLEKYQKAVELNGYMRSGLANFPALDRYDHQMHHAMVCFMGFLDDIKNLRLSKELLGTIAPLMADHMWREECYYLTKLAEAANTPNPQCDPTKPRLEA